MLLTKVEAWTHGGSSAASHLRLLCYLLQSSLAAQRQLFEDPSQAGRSAGMQWHAICILNSFVSVLFHNHLI